MSRYRLCSKVAVFVLLAGVTVQAETDWNQILSQARQLQSRGRTREAEAFLLKAWKEAERSQAGPQWVAALCHHLGLTYFTLARYDESERFFTRALRNWESTTPPHPKDLVATANGLFAVYLSQFRIARAEALFRSSAGAVEESLDWDDPERARWRCNWASVLYRRGDFRGAERMFRESLQAWERALGPDGVDVVSALNNLGITYLQMHRRDDSLRCFERIRSISEKTGMRLEQPLVNLAGIYRSLHRDKEAEALYRQALGNIEAESGPDHPLMAVVLEEYASALRQWKRKSEAARLHRQAKDILARYALTTPARQSVDVHELALRRRHE